MGAVKEEKKAKRADACELTPGCAWRPRCFCGSQEMTGPLDDCGIFEDDEGDEVDDSCEVVEAW